MKGEDFVSSLTDLNIDNVFIYVGDAVRWDYTSNHIQKKGVTLKTIASSTHSPTSFASLISGINGHRHGVDTFSDSLSKEIPTLLDVPGYDSRFLNSIFYYASRNHDNNIDPIYPVLGLEPPLVNDPFKGLNHPYISMERGPGGHSPYGVFEGTGFEYFRKASDLSCEKIRDDYKITIEQDAQLFEQRLKEIERNGKLKSTLVIYTSDHGEILGEDGILGHNGPMRPELVYVPTIFIHPDLPQNIEVPDLKFHHIDLFPTILSIIGEKSSFSRELDGDSLLDNNRSEYGFCMYRNTYSLNSKLPPISFHYEGLWNQNGGYVFPQTSRIQRLMFLTGQLIKSPKSGYLRRNLIQVVKTYLKENTEYGNTTISQSTAKKAVSTAMKAKRTNNRVNLSDEAEQHLKDLGYI